MLSMPGPVSDFGRPTRPRAASVLPHALLEVAAGQFVDAVGKGAPDLREPGVVFGRFEQCQRLLREPFLLVG